MNSTRNDVDSKAASPEEKLLTAVQEVQEKIRDKLSIDYAKAFNPHYKFRMFHNAALFDNVKKPVAKTLLKYAVSNISNLHQLSYFIAEYQRLLQLNNENDPTGFFDGMRKKHQGGELGGILAASSNEISALDHQLATYFKNKLDEIQVRLEMMRHVLTALEEMEFARFLLHLWPEKMPIAEYHIQCLDDLKKRPGNSFLIQEIDTMVKWLSDPSPDKMKANMRSLRREIKKCHSQRLEIDAAMLMGEVKFLNLNVNERLRYLVTRELLRGFVDNLKMLEKKFLWRWFVRAINGHMSHVFDSKISKTVRIRTGADLVTEARKYYVRREGQANDLFENGHLSNQLMGFLDEIDCAKQDVSDAILKQIEYHLDERGCFQELENKKSWEMLWKFQDTKWGPFLIEEAKKSLISPLKSLGLAINYKSRLNAGDETEEDSRKSFNVFSLLPQEIRSLIFGKLSAKDLVNLRHVDKFLYSDSALNTLLDPNTNNILGHIPPELRDYIYKYLSGMDLAHLRQTAKFLAKDEFIKINMLESEWSSLFGDVEEILSRIEVLEACKAAAFEKDEEHALESSKLSITHGMN
ncbi:F-box protein [Aquicella lusitana]|uniref:F-box domain-containing protein n=1 Tax=Aquicella lusitana TaxID=254246 RepID=A0A370GI34_9COXI|nr:F-box protein [Aquicella lusitana]RDI42839.1 hypothetical protein C8D86_11236 [Aquicella lusitana]VVC73082.1 hypothetical protein AQULUS_08130 [Aquicella lusitana]